MSPVKNNLFEQLSKFEKRVMGVRENITKKNDNLTGVQGDITSLFGLEAKDEIDIFDSNNILI